MNGAYYASEDGELLVARNCIYSPSGTYPVADHAQFEMPIDGRWRWFETDAEARAFYGLPDPPTE